LLSAASFLRNRHDVTLTHSRRRLAIQVLALSLIALVFGFFGWNLWSNVQRLNLPIGFGFLDNTAGFDIPITLIEWNVSDNFMRAIVIGLLNTLLAFAITLVLGTLLGLAVGLLRLGKHPLVSATAASHVAVFRNTPALLQIVFLYVLIVQNAPGPRAPLSLWDALYFSARGLVVPAVDLDGFGWAGVMLVVSGIVAATALPHQSLGAGRRWLLRILFGAGALLFVTGSDLDLPTRTAFAFRGGVTITPELLALTLGLSLYFSAYIAEIVRAGILAVPKGLGDAAHSLGLHRAQALRLVTFPIALRLILPPLTSQYLNMVKGTSLGVAIAYPDVVQVLTGAILNRTGNAIEIMGLVMTIFLVLSLSVSSVMNIWNRRTTLAER
jgi:general L-amino acid transport system permease protein